MTHIVERAFQEQHAGRKTSMERVAEVQRRFMRDSINWLILTVGVTLGGGLLVALGAASEFPPLTFVGLLIAVVGGLMFTFRFLTAAIAVGVRQGLELSRLSWRSGMESDPHLASERPDAH